MNLSNFEESSCAQWTQLINKAINYCDYKINHHLAHYLVITLQHYSSQLSLPHTIIGKEYLQALELSGIQKGSALRQIGDECLILTGLFPGKIQQKKISLAYTVNIGKMSYLEIFNNPQLSNMNVSVFQELDQHFIGLVDILYVIRHIEHI
jgi:hypothetical protein